jgi:predicted dinucleotide-binding enzyme
MKIAIIGTGKMGKGFAAALSPHHEVVFGSRDPEKAAKVGATGAARATSYEAAASSADIVILAVLA